MSGFIKMIKFCFYVSRRYKHKEEYKDAHIDCIGSLFVCFFFVAIGIFFISGVIYGCLHGKINYSFESIFGCMLTFSAGLAFLILGILFLRRCNIKYYLDDPLVQEYLATEGKLEKKKGKT
ncbi:MAG: hypothetical protein ACPL07_03630 [Candidatus Bathyarchaeia archaeon]